jgi:hypothetical protein
MSILEGLKTILKQPYWVIVFAAGALMVGLPCVSFDKNHNISTHNPQSWFLVSAGGALIILSVLAFLMNLILDHVVKQSAAKAQIAESGGLDTSQVLERDGALSTKIGDCEIRVIFGRLEDFRPAEEAVFVLPCNEYFDRGCVADVRSALGAYVNRAFAGRGADFATLVEAECWQKLGPPEVRQKTNNEAAPSFGPGRCLLLRNALNTDLTLALVSTTTQRAGEGLIARISYVLSAMTAMVTCLAETPRVKEAAMPVLGAGHGCIDSSLALVGTLLALAEVVRYGIGAQRLKKVTIVVFRRHETAEPEVHPTVVRRALALIAQ